MDRFTFGKYLAHLREQAGYSQKELAKLVGCSNSTISRIEKGAITNPSPSLFIAIAPLIGTTKDDLMRKFGYLSEDDFGEAIEGLTTHDRVLAAISDDDEMLDFFTDMAKREDLRIILRQVRRLKPKTIKQVIKIIQAIEEGEEE